MGNDHKFKRFAGEENSFLYKNQDDFSEFDGLFEKYNIKPDAEVVAITLYTQVNSFSNESNTIDEDKIDGILIYQASENQLKIKLYIRNNQIFEENLKLSNLKTNILTANDITDISLLNFQRPITPVSLIDFKALPKTNLVEWHLQNQIRVELVANGISAAERKCTSPCPGTTPKSACTAQERQNGPEGWFCVPLGKCPKEDADDKTLTKPTSRGVAEIAETNRILRSFRDNYLLKNNGGKKAINLYYSLSIPAENLTVDFCIETLDIIDNEILQIITNLEENPKSNTILITNSRRDKISTYLLKAKELYDTNEDKAKINQILEEVNNLSNKSNLEITTYLENQ